MSAVAERIRPPVPPQPRRPATATPSPSSQPLARPSAAPPQPITARCPDSLLFPADHDAKPPAIFVIRAGYTTGILAGIAAVLFTISMVGMILNYGFGHDRMMGLRRFFDVDEEANVPTYFQATTLLLSAAIACAIWRVERRRKAHYAGHWGFLSLLIAMLACDEAAQFHELFILPLRHALHARGVLFFTWVIPGMATVLICGAILLRFFLQLPRRTRVHLAVAATLYFSGALGMEMLDGWYMSRYGNTLTYGFLVHVEEGMEMAGQVALVYALLSYFADQHQPLTLDVQRA